MDPLHATIEEFAADGYTHVECFSQTATDRLRFGVFVEYNNKTHPWRFWSLCLWT